MLNFSPESKEVKVGDSFNINVVVDPQGESLDTVRAVVSYPADKLKVIYFALNNLYPNVAPGNFIDNNNGLLSQGGAIFGGQVSTSGTFGVITFEALAEGEATISATNSCRLISAGEEKIDLSSLGSAVITISKKFVEEVEPAQSPADIEAGEEVEIPAGQIIVQSSSHPDQEVWYNSNTVELTWEMAEGASEIVSYVYDFDQDPETDPSSVLNKTEVSKTFENVQDGVSYFHIKARFADLPAEAGKPAQAGQTFSDTIHYRIMIDTVEPNVIMPATDEYEIAENESTELRFGTTDQTSGIDYYEVSIDAGDFKTQTSPYTLKGKDLGVGEHLIVVNVFDKAGNVTFGAVKMNVKAKEVKPATFWSKYGALLVLLVIIVVYLLFVRRKKR